MWARALTAALVLGVVVDGALLMVYSVQRHGARNVLPKSSLLKETDAFGGPTLLPQGRKQCFDAGVNFRQRYIDAATCNDTCLVPADAGARYGVVNSSNVTFSNYNTLVNSSSLHRTILSANSFFMGVFPPDLTQDLYLGFQSVPAFTVDDAEDWRIRAYTKCPAYDRALSRWFGSEDFLAKEAKSKPVRDAVAAASPELNTSLANWWNVFDSFNVYRAYGVGDAMPALDEATYQQVVDLANWLETAKMRSNITQNMLGGALLADVLVRMENAAKAVAANKAVYYKLLSVSSHYNTQLGLLAALGVDQVPNSDLVWLKKIPATAAVLALELHKTDDSALWVRVVAQDGPGKPYAAVPLPCSADKGQVKGACSYDDFVKLAGLQALGSVEAWCSACGNQNMLACKAVAWRRLRGSREL